MVEKTDQGQRQTTESLKIEVKILKRGMIDAPRLEWWLEDMDSEITPVLELLDERMKDIGINAGTGDVGVGAGITDIAVLEEKWEGQPNEVVTQIDRMDVFAGGSWFCLRMECVEFSEKHILVGQFQWFIDIVN